MQGTTGFPHLWAMSFQWLPLIASTSDSTTPPVGMMLKNGCSPWSVTSAQNCTVNQNWDKTFELQNTTVMSALLDCHIMNIYCIMKMWWHLEQSHLTLSSCASVSSLPTNAFCSKGMHLKRFRVKCQAEQTLLESWGHFRLVSEFWRAHMHIQRCSILHTPTRLFISHSQPSFLTKYFCWSTR